MRVSKHSEAFLERRRGVLQEEIRAGLADPEGVVFVGGPLVVQGRPASGQGRVEGPAGTIGLGFLGPIGSDVQARPLLRHVQGVLREGKSELSRKLSQRILRFAERKLNAGVPQQRSAARELRGGGR